MKTKTSALLILSVGLALAGWEAFANSNNAGLRTCDFTLDADRTMPASNRATATQMAPSWKLDGLDGKPLRLADLKGKVVLLNFWATWCPPCRAEIPDLLSLQKKYAAQGLVVVGVSLDEGGMGTVKPFVKRAGITYPVVLGDQAVAEAYGGIQSIPTSFIIDRGGRVVNAIQGGSDLEGFEKMIKPVLQASAHL